MLQWTSKQRICYHSFTSAKYLATNMELGGSDYCPIPPDILAPYLKWEGNIALTGNEGNIDGRKPLLFVSRGQFYFKTSHVWFRAFAFYS